MATIKERVLNAIAETGLPSNLNPKEQKALKQIQVKEYINLEELIIIAHLIGMPREEEESLAKEIFINTVQFKLQKSPKNLHQTFSQIKDLTEIMISRQASLGARDGFEPHYSKKQLKKKEYFRNRNA